MNFVDHRCDVCLTKQETTHWPVLHKGDPLSTTFTRRKISGTQGVSGRAWVEVTWVWFSDKILPVYCEGCQAGDS